MAPNLHRLFSLEGKRALITGASGGIGKVLAQAFAATGAVVGLHGTNAEKLAATKSAIEGGSGKCEVFPFDLKGASAAHELIAAASKALEGLDILVNCAGTNRRKPIRDVTSEDFQAITRVNLESLFFLCQAAQPVMQRGGGGKIINVGSVTTSDGLGGVSVYGMTKAGVGQLTKTMALEWAKDNIQVNCLAPGFMLTPLTEKGLWGDAHRKSWLTQRIPMGRPGNPEELIGAALLLASNASSYMTGQIINVDGGYLAGGSWLREDE